MKLNSLLVLIALFASIDIAAAGLSKGPRASDAKKAAEPERGFAEIPKDKVTPCRDALEFYFSGGGSKCTAGLGIRFKEGYDNTRIWTARHDFQTIDPEYDGARPKVIKGKEGPYFPVLEFEYDGNGRLVQFKCSHHNSSPSGPLVAGFDENLIELEYDIDGPGTCKIKGAERSAPAPSRSSGGNRID